MKHKSDTTNKSIRIIYILGYGRSGSTLLDILLNSHPAMVGVGELHRSFLPNRMDEARCSCGHLGNSCPFWTTVLRQWGAHPAVQNLAGYHRLQTQFERLGSLPRLWKERHTPSAAFLAYAEQTQALFAALQQVSDTPIIIDSSKAPARALALSLIPGLDLQVIHLVRDGRGVAWSKKKDALAGIGSRGTTRAVLHTALMWQITNLISNRIRWHLGPQRAILCRYEDLVQQPEQTLTALGRFIELDLSTVITDVLNATPLHISHIMSGNAVRKSGSIKLKPDREWQHKLSSLERHVVYALNGWLMRQYGYSRTLAPTHVPSSVHTR